MKKYEKPKIVFEDFSLSNSVAASCEVETPLPSSTSGCGIPIRGGVVFMEGLQCTHSPQNTLYEALCYHVPEETYNLFGS